LLTTRIAKIARALFARPADTTAYAVGDLVANPGAAAAVVPLALELALRAGGAGLLKAVRLHKSTATTANAQFRVHFFRKRPTAAAADNAAFSANGFASMYIGFVDVTVDTAHSDGASGRATADLRFDCDPGVKTIFALVEARAAYAPGNAEQFRVTVESDPD